jgi:hypothetical protein
MKKLLTLLFAAIFSIATYGQSITPIAPGGQWGTVRGQVNTNFKVASDSIKHLKTASNLNYGFIQSHADSIADHILKIAALQHLQPSYAPKANPVFTGIAKINTDTLATQAYARAHGGGGGGGGLVGDGTVPPFFDGSSDGGQTLTFYGDNGFWTALQGGAPTANRSYRLPIAALPSAGTTALMNIDQWGNMGFISSTTYQPLATILSTFAALTNGSGILTNNGAGILSWGTAAGSGTVTSVAMTVPTGLSISGSPVTTTGTLAVTLTSGYTIPTSAAFNAKADTTLIDTKIDAEIAALEAAAIEAPSLTQFTDSTAVLRSEISGLRQILNDIYAGLESIGVDLHAPTIDSLEIGRFMPDAIRIWFSEPLITNIDSVPSITDFSLTEDGVAKELMGLSFANDSIMNMGLVSAAKYGSEYRLTYVRSYPYIRDAAGNPMANFSNRLVDNNFIPVESILVGTLSGENFINTNGGQRTFYADISPNNATDTTKTWSLILGTGTATLDVSNPERPTLTATGNGTVTVRATANDGSGVYGEVEITITNQAAPGEMISNGTFDSGDDWTANAPWTIGSGVASHNNTAIEFLTQVDGDMLTSIQPNTAYTITFTVIMEEYWSMHLGFMNASEQVTYVSPAYYQVPAGESSKTFSVNFTTPADLLGGGIAIRASTASTGAGSIDNVSLKLQ